MAKDFRGAYILTGGGTGSLDSITSATFEDLDATFVQTDGMFYPYHFDAVATDAEDSPLIIRPDDYSTAGVHKLQGITALNLTLHGNLALTNSSILELEDTTTSTTGVIYKGANRFIHNFHHPTGGGAVPTGRNTFVGDQAGNFTMGSTATSTNEASYNTVIGYTALFSNTTGSNNTVNGYQALFSNTTGSNNTANGRDAGRYITGGATANETSGNSIYIGYNTKASADGNTNETVIGYNATGNGSNTITLGDSNITATHINGGLIVNSLGVDVDTQIKGLTNDNLFYVDAGNDRIGIGTNVPNDKLQVVGGDITLDVGQRVHSGGSTFDSLLLEASNTTLESRGDITMEIDRDSTDNGTANFIVKTSADQEIFRIKETGDVGIGLTSPTAQLHVDQNSGTGAQPVLLLKQTDVSEEMMELDGTTIGVGNAIEAVGAKTLTTTHFIKVTITGVGTRYIPCGTIA